MAFSRFLQSSVYRSMLHQMAFNGSHPALAPRRLASTLSASSFVHRQTNHIRVARPFHTSPVLSCEHPHEHAKLWIVEKATSALMVPLVPLALVLQNRIVDSILSVLIIAHTFWGLEALVVEYIRVLLFGPFLPKVAMAIVYVLTMIVLGGLFYLNFNGIGLSKTFWKIWNNMKKPYVPPPKCPRSAPTAP